LLDIFLISVAANSIDPSHMKDAESSSVSDIHMQSKVDLDVGEEVEESKIGKYVGSSRGRASAPDGNSEPSASSECQNRMEVAASILKDTEWPQCGRFVESGRRRGRSRGRGSSGRGRNSYAHQVLRRERELEQRSDADGLVKV
jgi:hypothetical protein